MSERTEQLHVRLTPEEKRLIGLEAHRTGLTMTGLLRLLLLERLQQTRRFDSEHNS